MWIVCGRGDEVLAWIKSPITSADCQAQESDLPLQLNRSHREVPLPSCPAAAPRRVHDIQREVPFGRYVEMDDVALRDAQGILLGVRLAFNGAYVKVEKLDVLSYIIWKTI